MELIYKRPDTGKCYWDYLRDCLKGHRSCARRKCSDYLTIARAKKLKRRWNHAYQVERAQGK